MANEFKVKKGLIVDGSNTVLDIQGTQGQLFSVTDSLTGDLFSVSDVSGIPIFNVNSSGMSTFDGDVTIDKDSARLIIQDNSTGNALNQWISYRDSTGTEKAYLGYGSTSNSTFYIVNHLSDLMFYAGGVLNETKSGTASTFIGDVNTSTVQISSGQSYSENIRMFPHPVNDYSSLILGAVSGTSGTGVGQWSLVRYPAATHSNKFSIRHNSTDAMVITTGGATTFAGDITVTGTDIRTGANNGLNLGDDSNVLTIGRGNELWTQNDVDANATLYINYRGYDAGTTRFRSLDIRDGKNGQIAHFDGTDKKTTFAGKVGVAGKTPTHGLTLAQGTGVGNKIVWSDSTPDFAASIYASNSTDKLTFATKNASNVETTALEIDTSQNATFTGTISSGAISSSASVIATGNSNSFGNTTTAALGATSGTFSASVTAAGNSNSFGNTSIAQLGVSGFFSNSAGGKFEVQNSTDGTSANGIYMWNTSDSNWGIYMGQAGTGKSLADGTAASGIDGRTEHAIRFRAADSSQQIGFLWENNSEEALMQLVTDTGKLFTRGSIYPSNQTTNYVDSTQIGQWNTAHSWGNHANGGYAADNTVVKTSGNQSVGGVKTFTNNAIFEEKVIIGDNSVLETTFPAPNASLHVHEKVSGSGVAFGNEAHVVISTGATSTGAQGYQGSLWFGSSDHPAAGSSAGQGSQFVWRNAGIASTSGTADTGGSTATGNLEFYVNNGASAGTKALEIASDGDVFINANSTHHNYGGKTLVIGGSRATLSLLSSGSLSTIAMHANGDASKDIHINHDGTTGGISFFQYSNGSTESLKLDGGGHVGINLGTSSPSRKLHVVGGTLFSSNSSTATSRSTSGVGITFTNNNTFSSNSDLTDANRYLSITNDSTTSGSYAPISLRVNPGGSGFDTAMADIKLVANGNDHHLTTSMRNPVTDTFLDVLSLKAEGGIDIQGSVGQLFSVTNSLTGDLFSVSDVSGMPIFNVNSSGAVDVDGTFTSSGDIVAYSDERLKTDIQTLDGSKVYNMRGVSFTKDDKKGSGVIAQELEKIAPELVSNNSEFKAVAYGNLTGYLIEAIKELKAEIEELKKEIK